MVRGAPLVLSLALTWLCVAHSSVLVPTYVLPPDSFVRDQRSLGPAPDSETGESQRTIKRLIGGHMKIKTEKEHGSPKNSITFTDKSDSVKFNGVIAPDQSGGNVGWNQGIWDDGMLMSSAGEGKETKKIKEDDEDKKTLSDQVAEGKYGLIQNELFSKTPKRPGILSYETNTETRSKDNLQNLGGLKKDEIWLAEDNLLVIKGGSFPERTQEADQKLWPPIDNYEAPRRQVKLPQKPKIPPPFPVRLSDDGPLIFLTPNGSVPASFFPTYPSGEGEGPLPPPPFLYPSGTFDSPGENKRNTSSGGPTMSDPPFPFLPGNASEGTFPFPPSMNGSFPEGFPPGAAFLPPPSNQTDLYDEDDPSIYYPPPYNFSYRTDYKNNVPAGPLVPGIILPPPPDFFAPLEEKSTTEEIKTTSVPITHTRQKTTMRRPSTSTTNRGKYKTRPTSTELPKTTEIPTTTSEATTTVKHRKPQRLNSVSHRIPVRIHNQPEEIISRPKTEKPVHKSRTKLTSKPLSVSVIYDYPNQVYDNSPPATTQEPYSIYSVPQKVVDEEGNDITSTSVPIRSYYSNIQNDEIPTTKLQPVYNRKPQENAIASFYFFDEQPKTSKSPDTYYDGRNYYDTVQVQSPPKTKQNNQHNQYEPAIEIPYSNLNQANSLFLFPQKNGPRTLTQEYFSIQNPRSQPVYTKQAKPRPQLFYQQIADIQQTIDFFTTKRPPAYSHRPYTNKQNRQPVTTRPVYQFSYETQPRPEKLVFRAPKLDPEPFRPMVSYSKPLDLGNDFNAITPSVSTGYHQQYLVENVQVSTESPTSSRHYPKSKPREQDYEDLPIKNTSPATHRNEIPQQTGKPRVNKHPSTTPNPISSGYYTKQDERYIDDFTKNSFDIFGQKLEDNARDVNGYAVTPPLETVKTPVDNGINLQYEYEIVESQSPTPPSLHGDTVVNDRLPRPPVNPDSEPVHPGHANAQIIEQRPPSLEGDTLVNDRFPRPQINPDSEFIPIPNPNYGRQPQQYRQLVPEPQYYAGEQYDLNRPSLVGDTDVNYRRPLPAENPDAEWIGAVNSAGEGRPGSLVRYRLPGEGGHVYFLTPQAAQAVRERYRAPAYGR
ncbi:uncharacterized protein LOC126978087 [Leptidea sinapis]|uniref:uncharacterized protein LOC126978087 n=1 Tax=Leptidea sinapis TaxID=189913 RepID=UPI00212AA58E|nr:uncharacterized protein LOC126978087 [Leptidea sinapis]